jgi:hypothetical protein
MKPRNFENIADDIKGPFTKTEFYSNAQFQTITLPAHFIQTYSPAFKTVANHNKSALREQERFNMSASSLWGGTRLQA